MTRMVRAWHTSLKLRVVVLVVLFGVATLAVLSRQSVALQNGARQTKVIGKERLVSVQQLPQLEGPFCPDDAHPSLMASLQPPPTLLASMPQQRTLNAPAGMNGTPPPRPNEALKAEIAKRQPSSNLRDPRNVFSGLFIDTFRNE